MEKSFDLRIERTVRFKNSRLFEALQKWPTVSAFCAEFHLRVNEQQRLYALINLRDSPYNRKNGRLSPFAQVLVDALGIPPGELFPPELYVNAGHFVPLKSVLFANSMELVSLKEAANVASNESLDDPICAKLLGDGLARALSTLKPWERETIEMRFGLNGKDESFLRDVAKRLNVSIECIRQIEGKALRKLRHPSRSNLLKVYLS